MADILATLEEYRFWVVIGFGIVVLAILIIYVQTTFAKKANEKKAKARRAKRKAAAAGAPVNYDSNGMPLDDDDDGEFRDAKRDDLDEDGEAVYKDWD